MIISRHMNQIQRRHTSGRTAAVIQYDETSGDAPKLVAHGKGQIAEQIIDMAKRNNIHMQEDPLLVENLLDMDLGDNIPPQLYSVMAEILLLIEEMEKNY
ncbi:EscU/YscU/HrcU family type III secretion system export apparatus switch protein [Halalkalibacterium halodurans]|uniref:Flagellar biosynthesis (FlhS-related protein) n=2 Tax=Halalkalibacterium halodurans TaxID=86665 RepID=Q9KCU4_HALH5|nr:EscU/YscU/HrcU family type III secretion system export apparatus switch protein [Halalkalibacterium halodurans]MED3646916.1 EscU/YscU/HrcU family type III secretion system export apparatus switch protein [Halalkalibacterium halodurans]MED4082886.1 EscU/YscU/HrcU family type III secretion system export apparatus switch protein [Halalkalibacterium halodurans]MED4084772.1 EscU/YscU/HrcU family type III secretion system export apparatus switch protein [Halalkalibacterium halodurans]MED4106120.1 